jgi:hypothetical protein
MGGGTIKFTYRALHDVVIATVEWKLETEDDVAAWYEEYRRYFSTHFTRKVDIILDLCEFEVSARVSDLFGRSRAKILAEFTNRSYRVHMKPSASTLMYTNSVLHGGPANNFESIDAAIRQLEEDRKADGEG